MRTSNKHAQLLLHCSFTKTWSKLQQGVWNKYYIFRACLQPYLYSMSSTCTVLHYHTWPVSLHIFPHCLTKQHNFQKHVKNIKCVLIFSTERTVPCERTDRMKLTAAFRNFAKLPSSYNMHVQYFRSSKGKDQHITCHQWHRSISPFILNLDTRQWWTVNTTLSHITPRKDPPTLCKEGRWAPGPV